MGVPILIMGPSGSGKSTSLRNFTSDEVGIFNVSGKPEKVGAALGAELPSAVVGLLGGGEE